METTWEWDWWFPRWTYWTFGVRWHTQETLSDWVIEFGPLGLALTRWHLEGDTNGNDETPDP